ncbi:MAG: signal peptidase II [Patescibacteria group bacterium]|nr:signal peptidase II [Patescibacteria group bacterium]
MKKAIVVIVIIATDQITKYLAIKDLLSPMDGLFGFVSCNPNISWSIPLSGTTLAVAWLVSALIFIAVLNKTNWDVFLLGSFAGALSNAIDRIYHGCVIDFISIRQFPLFNIADSCITVGIMLFLLSTYISNKKNK